MQEKKQLLYCGDYNSRIISILPRFGGVTGWDGTQQFADYNMILIDCERYPNLASAELVQSILNNYHTIAMMNVPGDLAEAVFVITGQRPAFPIGSFIVTRHRVGNSPAYRCRFMRYYEQPELELMQKLMGFTREGFLYEGMRRHMQAMATPPTQNQLPPPYTVAPFGTVSLAATTVSLPVSNINGISQLQMTIQSELYCYHENAGGRNNFWIIAVTNLTNVTPGGATEQQKSGNTSGCNGHSYLMIWDQVYNYGITASIIGSDGKQISNGVTVNNTSPGSHGARSSYADEVNSSNVPPLYMNVYQGGAYQPVYFQPQYSRTLDSSVDPNLHFFDVKVKDNPTAATAGIQFSISGDIYYEGEIPLNDPDEYVAPSAQVSFESIHIFMLDGNALAPNGSLPIQMQFDCQMGVNQYYGYYELAPRIGWCRDHSSNASASGSQSVQTNQFDIVKITAGQSS